MQVRTGRCRPVGQNVGRITLLGGRPGLPVGLPQWRVRSVILPSMWVIVVCLVLVLAGLLAIIRWGGLAVQPPPTPAEDDTVPAGRPPVGLVVRRYLWYLTLAISAGGGGGLRAGGAGGRLVMRLLGVTAGPDAQGQITEADQVVGRI